MRLESAQNALRAPPGGNRNGQVTNPGRSCNFGLSARHATSTPETIDWRKKLAARDANAAILGCDPPGGEKRRLIQVAPATAARPTGRSAGAHPEIMSQKARKSVARKAAARLRPTVESPVATLKGQIQRALATRLAIAAREGAAGRKSAHGGRLRGSASETSIRVLRRSADLSCSPKQGKHRGERSEMLRLRKPPSGRVEGKDLERSRSEWVSRHGAKHKSEREPRAIDGTKNEGGRDRPPSNRVDSREAPGVRRSALRSGGGRRSRVHLVHMVG